MMKGSTFALLFLVLILLSLILPCLGAGAGGKKGKEAKPVPNKQKEKDKQAKKDIRDYVKKTQDLVFGPIDDQTTIIAIALSSAFLVSLFMAGSYLVKWMNSALAMLLFVVLELWLYNNLEETIVKIFWQWYKFQNSTATGNVEL